MTGDSLSDSNRTNPTDGMTKTPSQSQTQSQAASQSQTPAGKSLPPVTSTPPKTGAADDREAAPATATTGERLWSQTCAHWYPYIQMTSLQVLDVTTC